jgi:hypothetical protein
MLVEAHQTLIIAIVSSSALVFHQEGRQPARRRPLLLLHQQHQTWPEFDNSHCEAGEAYITLQKYNRTLLELGESFRRIFGSGGAHKQGVELTARSSKARQDKRIAFIDNNKETSGSILDDVFTVTIRTQQLERGKLPVN